MANDLEGTTRREFLRLAALGGLAVTVGVPEEAGGKEPTVDDILKGTPFIEINYKELPDYLKRYENVFFMIYVEDNRRNGYGAFLSRNLAKVVRPISLEFGQEVVFLKIQDDRNTSEFSNIQITEGPAWLMYQHGDEKFRKEGGPNDTNVLDKWIQSMRVKFTEIYKI